MDLVGAKEREDKLAKGPIVGAVCGWYKVWDGFAVAFEYLFEKDYCWYYSLSKFQQRSAESTEVLTK